MIIFSAIAIYLTSLWDKGFIIKSDWLIYLKASLVIAAIYYLVIPVSKLILLPLNILTLGMVSVIFYALVLFFFLNKLSLIQIQSWRFGGLSFHGLMVIPLGVSQLGNIFLSAFSLSTVINLLEKLL